MSLIDAVITDLEEANLRAFGRESSANPFSYFKSFHSSPKTILNSLYRHNAVAHLICSMVWHSASNNTGDATRIQIHLARLVATEELAIEYHQLSLSTSARQFLRHLVST